MESIVNILKTNKKARLYGLGMAVMALVLMAWLLFPTNGYLVEIDGEEIGVVEKEADLNQVIKDLKAEKVEETGLTLKDLANEVKFKKVDNKKLDYLKEDELKEVVANKLDWEVDAFAIKINDKDKVCLASEELAQQALEKVKENYVPPAENVEVISLNFEEKIDIIPEKTNLSQVFTPENAAQYIVNGTENVETYCVKAGDNMWDIARAHKMTFNELQEANPEIQNNSIWIGQMINLVQKKPLCNLVAVTKVTQQEDIAYQTKYVQAKDLWRGQTKVIAPGENGQKEVKYQVVSRNGQNVETTVLSEKVVKEPVSREIRQGTKLMIASRGGGGSGQLAWPKRGRINSAYGNRRSGFHTGVDIGGSTGDPIYAAESGRVISAGWRGGYGYCVDIDHGGGLLTRYAHQSKILVRSGQQVSRGTMIGKVGSTGRSTGPHLHFEVRVNGAHKNPLRYLK